MKRLCVVRAGAVALLAFMTCLHAAAEGRLPADPVANTVSKVWVADNGDGTYKNPVLYADYSDPDAIRVGDDYYMTASSFDAVPGLPVLHSKDLVNWKLVGHVFAKQPPYDVYSKTRHGNGVWAPAIRYHNGQYFIFYPDPEYGIYMVKAGRPEGPWSEPLLIKAAKGWIDPCPLWDDDGNAYLVSGMAASRSGVKSILMVSRMDPDGTRLLDGGVVVFDGHVGNPTTEGPKFYKRNGYYYIFAPAGGVATGWQLVLRSKSVYGPYEQKIVMAQGNTPINGPHQGAWVETQTGESWFLHFQDKGAYGRVVHLQPMRWTNDWPVIGVDPDGDGKGEPVLQYKKPNVGKVWPVATPADSDEFSTNRLGLQWQWQANPEPNWVFNAAPLGFLRFVSVPVSAEAKNLWDLPNVLLQKFPGPAFTVTTKVSFSAGNDGDKTGLVVMGMDYAYLSLQRVAGQLQVAQTVCERANEGGRERQSAATAVQAQTIYLRAQVSDGAVVRFSYSLDGSTFNSVGEPFRAKEGRWIGAKVGLFAIGKTDSGEFGYADYDWFRFE